MKIDKNTIEKDLSILVDSSISTVGTAMSGNFYISGIEN